MEGAAAISYDVQTSLDSLLNGPDPATAVVDVIRPSELIDNRYSDEVRLPDAWAIHLWQEGRLDELLDLLEASRVSLIRMIQGVEWFDRAILELNVMKPGPPPGARLLVLGRHDVSEGGRLSWCTSGWT
jgi:hypothetical protein